MRFRLESDVLPNEPYVAELRGQPCVNVARRKTRWSRGVLTSVSFRRNARLTWPHAHAVPALEPKAPAMLWPAPLLRAEVPQFAGLRERLLTAAQPKRALHHCALGRTR